MACGDLSAVKVAPQAHKRLDQGRQWQRVPDRTRVRRSVIVILNVWGLLIDSRRRLRRIGEADFVGGPRLKTTIALAAFGALFLAKIAVAVESDSRFVKMLNYAGAREFIVVAEGEFEPRSMGSYSLKIYSGLRNDFPADDFVTGVVRPRDGTIEAVQFYDFDADGRAEIVVLIRSAGSGGYLSADVFGYAEKSLRLLASVAGLAKDADPIAALKETLEKRWESRSRGEEAH